MVVNYNDYNSSRLAIKNMIDNKHEMIKELEDEIYYLRKSMRILDTEFKEKINQHQSSEEFM